MIGYNPSHLNTNETLLEAFHRIEAYLKANPQYQVYQSSATYQEGTQEYALNTIIVPEGSTVGKGDVVLFSNVYYAVITAVSETTFSIETATNFRGAQGEQGPKGNTGATGDKGETGLPALTYSKNVTLAAYQSSFITELDGYNRTPQINDICLYVSLNTSQIINGIIAEIRPDTQQVTVSRKSTIYAQGEKGEPGGQGANGKDGNATLLYAGELSESITTVETAQITRPQNRGILVKDILISTAASTFGAMAQVTEIPTFGTTVTVSFIGTLKSEDGGGDGGTTLNGYEYSIANLNSITVNDILRLNKIFCLAKNIQSIYMAGFEWETLLQLYFQQGTPDSVAGDSVVLRFNYVYCNNSFTYEELMLSTTSSEKASISETKFTDGAFVTTARTNVRFSMKYLNDTEITL